MAGPIGKVFKAIVTGVRGKARGKTIRRYFKTEADMSRALKEYARLGGKGTKTTVKKAAAKAKPLASDIPGMTAKQRAAQIQERMRKGLAGSTAGLGKKKLVVRLEPKYRRK